MINPYDRELNLYLEQWYEAQIPSLWTRFWQSLAQKFCPHKHYIRVMFELRKSTRETDKNTSREYQYLQLRETQQYYKCTCCGARTPNPIISVQPVRA